VSLGRAVRRLRVDQGISQERLGELADLHRNYIGGIERGERNPTYTNILKIAIALKVKPSRLLELAGK
jgi:transcriptional regulator with XRE-family HTH domain